MGDVFCIWTYHLIMSIGKWSEQQTDIASRVLWFGFASMLLLQIVCLTDLEIDYINQYDAANRINKVVLPEFVSQGVLCFFYLVTGRWFMFLLSLPYLFYNIRLWVSLDLHLCFISYGSSPNDLNLIKEHTSTDVFYRSFVEGKNQCYRPNCASSLGFRS